jgi:hypothetical protein
MNGKNSTIDNNHFLKEFMNYIFGYGSLISPHGINGRGMERVYVKDDLIPAHLFNYHREWNTVFNGDLYLGLIKAPTLIIKDTLSPINGIIFPISQKDLVPFKISEGIGTKFNAPMYKLVNVTTSICSKLHNILNPYKDRILTCVTVSPNSNGIIPSHYFHTLEQGFDLWGPEFAQYFKDTTNPQEHFLKRDLWARKEE